MSRLIVCGAIILCARCAHLSSTRKAETDQLVDNILVGDTWRAMCAQDEMSTCKVTTRTPAAQVQQRCDCLPKDLFDADPRQRRVRS